MGSRFSTAFTEVDPGDEQRHTLSVVVIGGVPVGLVFAFSLAELMP